MKCENSFLADLAIFNVKYNKIVETTDFRGDLKWGMELSSKHLQSELEKNGVELTGVEGEAFNRDEHERAEGEGEIVDKVVHPGLKIKGALVSKATVNLKKQ